MSRSPEHPRIGSGLRLNQVTVAVADVPRAKAFYRGLGLVPIVESEHYVRFVVPGNGATFSVHREDAPVAPSTVVYFECDDLDRTVEALVAAGITFDERPADRRWRWREARLRDPDGNRLCLYRAGDDRLNPPWRTAASRTAHTLSGERFRAWLDDPARAWNGADGESAGRRRFTIVHVHDRTGWARWVEIRTGDPDDDRATGDGVLEVTFDADGRATDVREWSGGH